MKLLTLMAYLSIACYVIGGLILLAILGLAWKAWQTPILIGVGLVLGGFILHKVVNKREAEIKRHQEEAGKTMRCKE